MSLIDPEPVKPQRKGGEAVLQMRDEFKQLAQGYLELNEWGHALAATDMARRLEEFEAQHNITEMVWPARVVPDGYADHGKTLEEVQS